MNSAQKTLIDIASVSQRIITTLDRCIGRKATESLQLDKIVVGSRTVLEALNKTLHFKDGNLDDRLVDWLNSEEPLVCLVTLKQMEEILHRNVEYGFKSFFKASRPTHTQDNNNEVIKLFRMRKAYFHFLLTTGSIWNRESGGQQLHSDMLYGVNQVLDGRDFTMLTQPKSGDPFRVARAENLVTTEGKQGVDLGQLDGILGWLNAWNSRRTHERTLLLRQRDTCMWLPKTTVYEKWRNEESSFLWLHGKPGAGKSVLAASVIEGLNDALQDGEVLAYFYCDFRDERSTNAIEVLRSLLSQLLQQFRHHAVDPGDLIDKLVEERDGGASTIDNVTFLVRHISRAAEQFHKPPFLVIDALDECKDVEELLNALEPLQRSSLRLLTISRPLQVIKDSFSGFPFIDMEAMSYEISADIRLHVTRELDSHRRLRIVDPTLKDEIHIALCKKAGGMFRWVQCQLNTLKQCVTAIELREALLNLPGDLDTTYGRILLAIDQTKREGRLARRALDWLVVALQPLQLPQIMEGLSIDLTRRVLDHDSGPIHGHALLDALGSLVLYNEVTDVVILSHFSVKEYLMAESTRVKNPMYHIDQPTAHTRIALLCMCYIGICLRRNPELQGNEASLRDNSNRTASHFRKRHGPFLPSSQHHPLLSYVLCYGFEHLAYINPRKSEVILRAIKEFQSDVEQCPLQWEQFWDEITLLHLSRLTPKDDLSLVILIGFAPEPLFHSFIGKAKLKPKVATNPLVYAASFKKIEHARTLLSKGADVNSRGWDVHDQPLPLEVAVRHGDRGMVDLLLSNGSHVPHELFMEAFAKNYCYISPHILSRLLQTDEFVEWVAEVQNEELLLRALDQKRYHAVDRTLSEHDIDVIERRLVQMGHKPPPRLDEASIRYAVSQGHVATVRDMLAQDVTFPSDIILDACRAHSNATMIRLFLDKGGEPKATLPNGDTPLHLVLDSDVFYSRHDCLESVKVLIAVGCSPCAHNLADDTPLHVAVRSGDVAVVAYLLLLHIPLPTDILLVRSNSQTAAMIRLLVQKGGNVHAIAANGNTPLHTLGNSTMDWDDSCLECAIILIDAGCNPCVLDASGDTVLDIAVRNGHLPLVERLMAINVPFQHGILLSMFHSIPSIPMIKILIDNGADIHITDPNGNTPLHLAIDISMASEITCLEATMLLVEAGCDYCACNSRGRTPFHMAAGQRYVLIMEYLLSLGISVPPDVMLSQFPLRIFPIPQRYYPATRFLLDKGGDVQTVSEQGDTLLHLAASFPLEDDALGFSRLFVDAGCSPHVLNSSNESPLHIAARHGYTSVIDYYLSLGIPLPPDILLAASTGYSFKKAQVIRFLIAKGVDVSVVTADTLDRPGLIRVDEDELGWVNILIDAGCDIRWETLLRAAARDGEIDALGYFLSHGVPLPDDILLISEPRTIRFLLRRGIDVTCGAAADVGTELIHRALDFSDEESSLECAKILVNSGWDTSLKNSADEMPIHVALRHGHLSTIKYFLEQKAPFPSDALLVIPNEYNLSMVHFSIREGASVNAVASNGDSPLHLVLRSKFFKLEWDWRYGFDQMEKTWKVVEVLLNHGANPSARNANGQTPFDIAEANGHFFKENFLRLVRNAAHRVRASS